MKHKKISQIIGGPLMLMALLFCGCQPAQQDNKSTESSHPSLPEKPHLPPATGWINGQSWNFKAGRAFYQQHSAKKYLIIDLWNNEVEDPCGKGFKTDLLIRMKTLPRLGDLDIGHDTFKNVPVIIFWDAKSAVFIQDNIIASQGYVGVDGFEKGITGHFSGSYEAPNVGRTEVSGSFQVPLCDDI